MTTTDRSARAALMAQHVVARAQRDTAPLDSPEYRAACEEIARIEVAIAAAEEPKSIAPVNPIAAPAVAAAT